MPRKTKSIKKTDIKAQKPWLRKTEPTTYKIETRELNKTILIVVEGQTEKLYFDSFPVITLSVKTVDLKGQSKLKLIESTISIIEYNDIDFDNAISKGKSLGYNVAYSNDSFELWFFLHFFDTDQQNHRKFYYESLGKQWELNYEKEGKKHSFSQSIYSKLENDPKASQIKAISRAKRMFLKKRELPFHKQNPVTKIYELVQFLNNNLRP